MADPATRATTNWGTLHRLISPFLSSAVIFTISLTLFGGPAARSSRSQTACVLEYYNRDLHLLLLLVPDGTHFVVALSTASALHHIPRFVGLHKTDRIPMQDRMETHACLEILESRKPIANCDSRAVNMNSDLTRMLQLRVRVHRFSLLLFRVPTDGGVGLGHVDYTSSEVNVSSKKERRA
jgi:hypothetical protein